MAALEKDFLTHPKKLNEQKKEPLMALPSGAEIALANYSDAEVDPDQFVANAPNLAAKAARLGEKVGRKKPIAPKARKNKNKENNMTTPSENPSAPPSQRDIETKTTRKSLSLFNDIPPLPD
ncbi:MAG: hypothetical protein LBE01_04415, partial [Deltaproteobacteria bacterium]|nr:hypothetical protein [Deltaproteobacteria bacterium]